MQHACVVCARSALPLQGPSGSEDDPAVPLVAVPIGTKVCVGRRGGALCGKEAGLCCHLCGAAFCYLHAWRCWMCSGYFCGIGHHHHACPLTCPPPATLPIVVPRPVPLPVAAPRPAPLPVAALAFAALLPVEDKEDPEAEEDPEEDKAETPGKEEDAVEELRSVAASRPVSPLQTDASLMCVARHVQHAACRQSDSCTHIYKSHYICLMCMPLTDAKCEVICSERSVPSVKSYM